MSLRRFYLLVLGLLIAGSGDALALMNGTGTGSANCLGTEKKVCSMGPPPICHCEPLRVTNKKDRGAVGPTGVSGTKNSNSGKH